MTDPLPPHFGDRYVLDPLFQDLAARRVSFGKAKRLILKALQDERILVSEHVAEGVWSLQPRDFATREEAMRVEEKARALRNKFAFTAAEELFYEQTPSGGQTSLVKFEAWGYSITVTVDNYRLRIVDLIAYFPPESCSYRVVKSVTADELLAAASPVRPALARLQPVAFPPLASPPSSPAAPPPDTSTAPEEPESNPAPAESVVRFEDLHHGWQIDRVYPILRKLYPPAGKVPPGISALAVWRQVNKDEAIKSENRTRGIRTPSEDAVAMAMKELRRLPD